MCTWSEIGRPRPSGIASTIRVGRNAWDGKLVDARHPGDAATVGFSAHHRPDLGRLPGGIAPTDPEDGASAPDHANVYRSMIEIPSSA
jgi:hypothetical protein